MQLSVKEYEYLIEELEMKEDIALYEKVKADKKAICPLKIILKNERKNNSIYNSISNITSSSQRLQI